jgi:uncharacterized LabA/DUF88 family protein
MRDIAILVDGGFFIKRLQKLGYLKAPLDPADAIFAFNKMCENHLGNLNHRYGFSIPPQKNQRWRPIQNKYSHLYRIFFYDAPPFEGRAHKPVSNQAIDFKTTEQAKFRTGLFEELKKTRNVALRLGELSAHSRWMMNERRQKQILRGQLKIEELTDEDFSYDLQQKGVDMRIGLDIATLTLKKQVGTIVLVTGDADFVPAAKLARREGVEIILDPLRNNISKQLFEHIDGLRHGLRHADEAEEPENEFDEKP